LYISSPPDSPPASGFGLKRGKNEWKSFRVNADADPLFVATLLAPEALPAPLLDGALLPRVGPWPLALPPVVGVD
jgi:hypothetical protein